MSSASYIGKLDDASLAEVLQNLYLNRTSGILDLQKDKDQRRIFILNGEVRSAMSNVVGHKIGQFLLTRGTITAAQLEAALKDVSHGNRLGQKLVHLGHLSAQELDAALKDLVRTIIQEAMGWYSGLFRLSLKDSPVPQDITLEISTAALIFQGTVAYASPSFVQTRLPLHAVLKPSANIKEYFRQLALTPHQTYLLSQANGRLTVDQILSPAPGNVEENLVILYAFMVAGLLSAGGEEKPLSTKEFFERFQDRATGSMEPKAAPKKRRRIKWIRPKIIQAELSPEDIQKIRSKIKRTFENLAQLSHYDILDCPFRATQKEIHYAFMALCTFYDPDIADEQKAFSDLKGQMEAIYDRMEEAYLALVDVKKRAEYDRRWSRRGL